MRDIVILSGSRLQCKHLVQTLATWLALSVAPLFQTTF